MVAPESVSFYAGLLEWDAIKVAFLICHIFETIIGPIILYSLIWYEYYSVDLRYRTVSNQLLSQCWWIQLVGCIVVRNLYLTFLTIGPLNVNACDTIISFGHFLYISTISVLGLRQIIKYLYIFQWNNVVSIDDNFFAVYFGLCIFTLSSIFAYVCYFLGYNNEDLDFHICAGRTPEQNIRKTLEQLSICGNDSSTHKWFLDGTVTDPLEIYSTVLLLVAFILTSHMCWYASNSKINNTFQIIFNVKCFTCVSKTKDQFKETNSKILGNKLSLFSVLFCFASLVPVILAKLIAKRDINEVNSGWTRALVYIGKMTLPLISSIICPLLVIHCNSKMKKSIIKELKDHQLAQFSKQVFHIS